MSRVVPALTSKCPSEAEVRYSSPWSLKANLIPAFKCKPTSFVWVRLTSLSAPNDNTALSDSNLTSLPKTQSLTTDKPPSVCKEPSVVVVASVASSVITLPANVANLLLSIFNTWDWDAFPSVV